ncbi:MBL fold metallo-hydrolase [Anaeromicropila populeti]|uniref:Glyoxylase, beta-lactamase superfamily II n=1 Tax=Anaeromicropila populeti TaxID=37658 RepID=A0A1I6JM53_9FIRM|nr:MBL fold metallo-hydrolase [Anaeromicropila populeti]SFR80029.1 Glyoxylase, beta-lactamase superfamily II [Anaeromicropila populeti]
MTYEVFSIKDQSITKNNVYLIMDKKTRHTAIVDTGGTMKQIRDIVLEKELVLTMVLITHTHPDHIRNVNEIADQYNCNVYVSEKEVQYYQYQCNNLQTFQDMEALTLGETTITCVVTPGHTKGSTCFLLSDSFFTGDTIFIEGCGICNTPGGSANDMYQSVTKVKHLVEDSVLVYPGHTYKNYPGKSMQFVKDNNIYFCMEEEEHFVSFRMRRNQNGLMDFI